MTEETEDDPANEASNANLGSTANNKAPNNDVAANA